MTNRFRCSTIALGTSALLAFVTAVPATAATIDEVDIFNTLYGTSETTASLNALLVPDAVWNLSGGATVTAEYKEASFLQTFGFYTDLGIGAVQTSLFSSISTNGYLAGSFPPVAFSPGVSFGFYTHPSVGGPYFTEAFTDGGFDHFRTYQTPQVGRFCTAPGFLDSGLTVFASTPPRPARGGRVAPGPGFGSRTSPASTARCTSA